MKYIHVILNIVMLLFMHKSNYGMSNAIKNDLKLQHYTSQKSTLNYLCKSFCLHPNLLISKNKDDVNKACLITDNLEALNADARLRGITIFLEAHNKYNDKNILTQIDTLQPNLKNGSMIFLSLALGVSAFYYATKNDTVILTEIGCIATSLKILSKIFEEEDDEKTMISNALNPSTIELIKRSRQAVSERLKIFNQLKRNYLIT